ncbi:MAG: holo-ACP synthase [Gloeobacteraceae cyanobacterium ES-bin-144]|nr:holo-ACP synthase [Verrucomicrobiales bacterium]
MHVFGIGIDVVEVDRIEVAIQRHGDVFLKKIFTPAEREYCESKKNSAMHYAARFAAKEAVSKALGTGIGGNAGLHDMEVVHDAMGAPKMQLSGAAERFAKEHGISDIQISLTHSRAYAAANAIAVG